MPYHRARKSVIWKVNWSKLHVGARNYESKDRLQVPITLWDYFRSHIHALKKADENISYLRKSAYFFGDVSRNDKSYENVVRKLSSTKHVYIVGDSIVKHVSGCDISRKTENFKVFVCPSHGATVRCMIGHIFFFYLGLLNHSRITGMQRKREGISLTPHYHFQPLHRQLDISRTIL